MKQVLLRQAFWSVLFFAIALGAYYFQHLIPLWMPMLPGHVALPRLVSMLAFVLAGANLMGLITSAVMAFRERPQSEAQMIGKLYRMAAILAFMFVGAYAWGQLGRFGELFSLFGGMVLGWSLQAPVSGFAAWILVSIKRPFRPGDRIQLPNLGLTGDVIDIGAMYVVLDQVGGTVGSEDAVGRHILVPNAMLFNQVVINFTVIQKAAYMLDEIVVRVTYDSDMNQAERIMLDAARTVTKDIIKATGVDPYIRSDLYDYGLYLRLRFQTAVQDRPKIAYEINKLILEEVQKTPRVDLAIPFIYSYRAGLDQKEADAPPAESKSGSGAAAAQKVRQIDISQILNPDPSILDPKDIEQLAISIVNIGLLQPIMVRHNTQDGMYYILAGHARFEACKKLGWKTISAIIKYE